MMKHLRFFFLSMLVMLTGTAFAGSIVFGELGLENGVQYSDPFDGGDFTVTFAGGGNDGKYYNAGSGIRVYGGGTMTIAAKEGTLTKVVVTFDGSNKPESADVVDGGTYDPATGVWTGNAAQVVFTRPSGSGHWRVQKIETGAGAEEPQQETEGQTPETAITVARALELIGELADGAKSSSSYYIAGKVTVAEAGDNGISTRYGNATFNMGDLVVFRAKGLKNSAITTDDYVKVGDDVVVYGQLQKFVKDDAMTPEVAQGGYIYSINGQTEPNPDEQPTEPTIEGGTTAETAITVAAAVAAIGQMNDGQKTTASYYVKGVVLSVTEISTANGNATFVMGDAEGATTTFTVYRAKGLEKKNIESEDYLKQGDQVVVYGQLQRYVSKDGAMTPELAQGGYIYSLNGKTEAEEQPVDPYDFVGDGTQQNPYTVADMLHMDVPADSNPVEGQEMVWVKGIIMGSLNSSGSALLDAENVAASNIALAATADETEAKSMLPVQLPAGNLRAALNVLDNPANVGKEVMVCGYMLKYMGRTGLKNVADFVLDGEQFSDGIATIAADTTGAPLYNVAGQRVVKAQKGLYIQSGKKFVVK